MSGQSIAVFKLISIFIFQLSAWAVPSGKVIDGGGTSCQVVGSAHRELYDLTGKALIANFKKPDEIHSTEQVSLIWLDKFDPQNLPSYRAAVAELKVWAELDSRLRLALKSVENLPLLITSFPFPEIKGLAKIEGSLCQPGTIETIGLYLGRTLFLNFGRFNCLSANSQKAFWIHEALRQMQVFIHTPITDGILQETTAFLIEFAGQRLSDHQWQRLNSFLDSLLLGKGKIEKLSEEICQNSGNLSAALADVNLNEEFGSTFRCGQVLATYCDRSSPQQDQVILEADWHCQNAEKKLRLPQLKEAELVPLYDLLLTLTRDLTNLKLLRAVGKFETGTGEMAVISNAWESTTNPSFDFEKLKPTQFSEPALSNWRSFLRNLFLGNRR